MNRKPKIFIRILAGFLLVTAACYGGYKFYQNVYFSETANPVTLRFHYMQYACGDCYPQWNADSVLTGSKKDLQFIDKDMQVYYNGKHLEDQLGEPDWNCIICSDFYMTGKVKKSLSGKYRFIADKYSYVTDTGCCNN